MNVKLKKYFDIGKYAHLFASGESDEKIDV